MIYQPKNVTPSNTSVDVRITNQYFSMEVATNNKVVAYKLVVLDWDNNERYVGTVTTLSTPLYNGDTLYIPIPSTLDGLSNGNDYKWYVYLYDNTSGVNQYSMKITQGIVQLTGSDNYVWIQQNVAIEPGMYFHYGNEYVEITSYSNGQITTSPALTNTPTAGTTYEVYSNFIKTSPDYVLHARKDAEVSINTIPATVTTRIYTFNGTYTQDDGEPMIWHSWTVGRNPVITHVGEQIICESYTLEYTTGKVYNANLEFTYDKFKSGETYVIFLDAESTYGNMARTETAFFDVNYQVVQYLEQPVAFLDCTKNAIQVDWVSPKEVSPSIINNDIYTGNIQPGTISTNSFYIEKNLSNITNYCQIIIDNVNFNITNYNNTTGLLTIEETVPNIITVGESYTISGPTDIPIDSAVTLYRNTPYVGVNSVDTKQYSLVYEDVGEYPEEYNITMQFKPDTNFFYGTTGLFNDINPLAIIESSAVDEVAGMMIIFIHKYDFCAATPELNGSVANIQTLGSGNTTSIVYLNTDIDLSVTPYIYFPDYGYIEKIISYDSETNAATLNKDLPFAPASGTRYVMMKTLIASFYNNLQDTWVLQDDTSPQSNLDYRWIDTSNSWNDTKYWVEGGTGIERVANYWWKAQITNDDITLTRGGV